MDPDAKVLGQLTNLRDLSLSNLPSVQRDLDSLAKLKYLESLALRGTSLSQTDQKAIGRLSRLKTLDLPHCDTPTDGWEVLKNLGCLEVLKPNSLSTKF